MQFNVNQIVRGKVGCFIILGFRTIGGEQYAQVKAYNPVLCKAAPGEMALPVNVLRPL